MAVRRELSKPTDEEIKAYADEELFRNIKNRHNIIHY